MSVSSDAPIVRLAAHDTEPIVPNKLVQTGSKLNAHTPAEQTLDGPDTPKKTLFKKVASMNGGRILSIGWKWKAVGDGWRK